MNVDKIRKDFPLLCTKNPPIYFDNSCVTLKPIQVIDKINEYYREYPACGGRSMHELGKRVTDEVHEARKIGKKFFNSKSENEIVFMKNTTEGINLVANSIGLKSGDAVVLTDKEHNSNLIVWLILQKKLGIEIRRVPSNADNSFSVEAYKKLMDKKVRLVSMVHTSNLDGTTIPAKEIIKIAHNNKSLVLLDGAQSAPHKEINLKDLDVDFFACSGHKMLGPSGTGILYGKEHLLESMQPLIVGGDTVKDSTYTGFDFEDPPERFEAGLQNYSGILGLGEAMNYLMRIGRKDVEKHEFELHKIITDGLADVKNINLIGPKDPKLRSGIFSFYITGMDVHNTALMLNDLKRIMVRSGYHCVHSWFNTRGIKGSVRASLYLYNTEEECNTFVQTVSDIAKHFS